jgi:hypothetical protein
MSIRLAVSYAAASALALCFATAAPGEENAFKETIKACGREYQAAKAANELKGQSWQDFLKACRARIAEPKTEETPAAAAPAATPAAPAATPAPAPTTAAPVNPLKPSAPATATPAAPAAPPPAAPPAAAEKGAKKEAAPAKPASEGQAAMRARQKKCGEEWKAQKAELKKKDPSLKWPKYWSECNKRLKDAGQ